MAAGSLLVLASCEHAGTLVFAPEVDVTESFESGLAGWTFGGVDVGPSSATVTTETASAGTHSLKLTLNGNVDWAEWTVQATPGQAYDVDLSFDFATADYGSANLWQLIAGALGAPPATSADLPVKGDTGNGSDTDVGYRWVHKSYTTTVTADGDGYVYVVLGVLGSGQTQRSYYLDNVHLVLTRPG